MMEIIPDIFNTEGKPASAGLPVLWRLVTNQRNLLFMLAAGLVMPPRGFGKKYYLDTLSHYPGWIPLFADAVPKSAIEHSISERNNLIPCVVTVNLDLSRGKVVGIARDGSAREINFPAGLDGGEWVLLIPAPLPIHWITSIAFQSREDKAACEADARDFGNVPLLDFKREYQPQAFSKAPDWPWPPTHGLDVSERAMDLGVPLAAGGMMAMLLQLGNAGDIGMAACRLAFDPDEQGGQTIPEPLIPPLADWMRTGKSHHGGDVSRMLFWGGVEKVAANQFSGDGATSLDVMLGHLESAGASLDERMRTALAKLSGDLRTIASFADSTITEIFERHPKTFSRVMALFFLHERCADLLEFKHPLLTESDYVVAAILFAARDGWLGLPLELRSLPGLQAAVTQRMAAMAHRIANSGFDLGRPPQRPLPLRELFLTGPKGWSKPQKEAALLLAHECKWGCIQTRISLGKGDYRLEVDGAGLHILVEGEVKAVVSEVDNGQFFKDLARLPVSGKQERKIRDLLRYKE